MLDSIAELLREGISLFRKPSSEEPGVGQNGEPRMLFEKTFGAHPSLLLRQYSTYFGITSRASLLATTSRISRRFFPASIIASRDP